MANPFNMKKITLTKVFLSAASYLLREVSDILGHAEDSAAEHFGRGREAVVDHTCGVADSQILETLVGGHWR